MSWGRDEIVPVPAAEAFTKRTIDELKPLALLLTTDVPKRKPELTALLASSMTNAATVRRLHEQLDPLARTAVQEATHDPKGVLHRDRFIARHGRMPDFHESSGEERV